MTAGQWLSQLMARSRAAAARGVKLSVEGERRSPRDEAAVVTGTLFWALVAIAAARLFIGPRLSVLAVSALALLTPVMIAASVIAGRFEKPLAPSVIKAAQTRALLHGAFVAIAGIAAIASHQFGLGLGAGELTRGLVQIAVAIGGSFLVAGLILALELPVLAAGPVAALVTRGRQSRIIGVAIQLDRIAGQLAAALTWVCAATWMSRDFFVQAAIWGGGVLVLPALFELWLVRRRPSITAPQVRWYRRIAVHATTGLGLGYLALQVPSPEFIEPIQPLVAAVVAVLLIRVVTWVIWRATDRFEPGAVVRGLPMFADVVLYTALVAAVVAGPTVFRDRSAPPIDDAITRQVAGANTSAAPDLEPSLEILLVSDNQFRSMGGRPAETHVQLIDDYASASLRPTTLDLLSFATLDRLAALAATSVRPDPWWAHAGDFGDLSCASELDRLRRVGARFADAGARFAGIARGNHDGFFLGTVLWAPDWAEVCGGGPAPSAPAVERLRELSRSLSATPEAVTWDSTDEPFLARVTVLPIARAGASRRMALVFTDTSDLDRWSLGIAGVGGSISERQCQWISALLEHDHVDYLTVIGHHPVRSLSARGRGCLERLAGHADLLAVVSAHTHLAAMRPCALRVGDRCVPELIAGSTTDAPQEAAWLRYGESSGRLAVQMTTVRPIDAETCGPAFAAIEASESCEALLEQTDTFSYDHDSGEVRAEQQRHARELLACLDALAGGEVECLASRGSDPLDDPGLGACLESASERLGPHMACLSWSASILADRRGISLGDVIDCEQGEPCAAAIARPYAPVTCTVFYGGEGSSCVAASRE